MMQKLEALYLPGGQFRMESGVSDRQHAKLNSQRPQFKWRRVYCLNSSEPTTAKALRHGDWSTSLRAERIRRDALIQFLIDDLYRAVDFGIGCAKLMRNQLHQQVDAFDGRRATSDRPGR
jgi:hypothetical protein